VSLAGQWGAAAEVLVTADEWLILYEKQARGSQRDNV